MINALSLLFPTLSFHHSIFSSSKAFKMVLSRTTFGFQRSYNEGLGFKYQNIVFNLKLSKLCYIHRLRYHCMNQNGLYTFKTGYKKRFIFDEGIEKFESYMENEHSLKPHFIIISKEEKSTRYDQSYTFSCD
jgi:hypothetical protein